jgi:hypothetical protein
MRIYNRTKVDDVAIKAVLKAAKTAVGSCPTNMAVRVSQGRYVHGIAFDYDFVLRKLMGMRNKLKGNSYVACDGFFEIWLPTTRFDVLKTAEAFFETAAHEMRHLRDFKKGLKFDSHKKRYYNRSHEKRAMRTASNAAKKMLKRTDWQEAVIALGLAIENVRSKINTARREE